MAWGHGPGNPLHQGADKLNEADQLRFGNLFPIDANSFAEVHQMRAGEETDSAPRRLYQPGQDGAGGALALAAGDQSRRGLASAQTQLIDELAAVFGMPFMNVQ